MKTKKGLKKYLHQLDMIYGGFDNFRVLYIQSLIDKKQLDIPIDEHEKFDDIFIKNFDLNCENFVDSSYNTIYEDIRTLFKFDDECIMGEIYDSEKIREEMSTLDYRKQQVVRQRYDLDNKNEVKYSEIAEKYSITIEWARQIKERAIMRLQMNTVYGRRLIVNRDEEKRRQFIIKYFENHDIFLDNEEIITEEEREELLGIIGYKGHIEENRNELPKEIGHKDDELAPVENNEPSEVEQGNDSVPVITIEELGLSARLYKVLNRAGIKTTKDLSNTSLRQFSKMRNMGEKSLEELSIKMHSLGIKIKDEEELSGAEIDSTEQKRKPIEALNFSARLYNALDRANIATVEDLLNTTETEFLRMRNMGEKTFDELMTKMNFFNIKPKTATETDEELLKTIQKLSRAYDENKKKGIECQELKQSISEMLDKIDNDSANSKDSSNIIECENESYANIDK